MARLLVAHSLHAALDPRGAAERKPFPPLGPLVTVAELERAGHDVAFYDGTFGQVQDFAAALAGHRPRHVAIVADPHAIAQKMCLSVWRDAMREMTRLARSAGAEVLVAGPDVSDHPEAYAGDGVTVVVGEHDDAVLAWAAGGTVDRARRAPRAELAGLAQPAWDRVDLGRYRQVWRQAHGYWELNVSTARGCPYRCNWCAKPTWGRRYAVRPADEVWAEVDALRRRANPDRVWFTDDIFAVRRPWLDRYAALASRDPMPFRALSRADLLTDPAAARALAAAGAVEIWLGAESGSDTVLAAMDKDGTVAEIRAATTHLRAAGIRVGFFLQLGYPGETYADLMATVRMVRELAPDAIGVSVSYPLPGTAFWERTLGGSADAASARWSGSMENRVMYASPFPQAVYDHARELLRAEHAMLQLRRAPSARAALRLPYHVGRWPLHRARLWAARHADRERLDRDADPGVGPGLDADLRPRG